MARSDRPRAWWIAGVVVHVIGFAAAAVAFYAGRPKGAAVGLGLWAIAAVVVVAWRVRRPWSWILAMAASVALPVPFMVLGVRYLVRSVREMDEFVVPMGLLEAAGGCVGCALGLTPIALSAGLLIALIVRRRRWLGEAPAPQNPPVAWKQ